MRLNFSLDRIRERGTSAEDAHFAAVAGIAFDNPYPRLFQNIEVSVGGYVINVNAGQIGVYFNGTFPALKFCADPPTWLLAGPTPVTVVPDSAFVNGTRLA